MRERLRGCRGHSVYPNQPSPKPATPPSYPPPPPPPPPTPCVHPLHPHNRQPVVKNVLQRQTRRPGSPSPPLPPPHRTAAAEPDSGSPAASGCLFFTASPRCPIAPASGSSSQSLGWPCGPSPTAGWSASLPRSAASPGPA